MFCCNASLYADDTMIYFYSSSSQELSDNLDRDLLAIAKWLNNHKLTLNLEKTKCMLVGSNRKLERKMAVIVSIFDHNVNNVNTSNTLELLYHLILHGQIMLNTLLVKLIKGLVSLIALSIYYLLVHSFLFIIVLSCLYLIVQTLFNVTLMTSLQVLQTKAAKIISDRPLYSSAMHALATHKWVPLEKGHFQRRCSYVYKCLNGLVEHHMNLIRQQEQHDYNTTTKLNLRLPSAKRNWGKQRNAFHAIKDFNSFSQAIRQSVNLNIFKRNLFKFVT